MCSLVLHLLSCLNLIDTEKETRFRLIVLIVLSQFELNTFLIDFDNQNQDDVKVLNTFSYCVCAWVLVLHVWNLAIAGWSWSSLSM